MEHFPSLDSLLIIYKDDLLELKKQVKSHMVISFSTIAISLLVLLMTFSCLEDAVLSLIPVLTLFALAVGIIFSIINKIKYDLLERFLSKELEVEKEFFEISLLILLTERNIQLEEAFFQEVRKLKNEEKERETINNKQTEIKEEIAALEEKSSKDNCSSENLECLNTTTYNWVYYNYSYLSNECKEIAKEIVIKYSN